MDKFKDRLDNSFRLWLRKKQGTEKYIMKQKWIGLIADATLV